MKRKGMLLLTLVLSICMLIGVYADTNLFKTVNSNEVVIYDQSRLREIAEKSHSNGIPATEITNERAKSKTDSGDNTFTIDSRLSTSGGVIAPLFIRHAPNSTTVQVYLTYAGSEVSNAIAFDRMDITSTSLIFNKTYGSLIPKVYPFQYPSTYYNVFLGTVEIPVNVNKVRVSDSGLRAYYLSSGWSYFLNILGEWPVN